MATAETLHAQLVRSATITVAQNEAQFGEQIRSADLNGDGALDLLIGAPNQSPDRILGAGSIYMVLSPIFGDTVLTNSNVILKGALKDDQIGLMFELGDFNGDGVDDLATASPITQRVRIFFGPLTDLSARSSSDADIEIVSDLSQARFGGNLHVTDDLNADGHDELLVSDNQIDLDLTNQGVAYLYNLNREFVGNSAIGKEDYSVRFKGTEALAQFGTGLTSFTDFMTTGAPAIVIGAHRSGLNGTNSGSAFIFSAPFSETAYQDTLASSVIMGDEEISFWASRLEAVDDQNGDSRRELAVITTFASGGKVALFQSDSQLPDSVVIGRAYSNVNSSLLQSPIDDAGFGFPIDFSTDVTLDDIPEQYIGAPFISSNQGRLYQRMGSQLSQAIAIQNVNAEAGARFGSSMAPAGNIITTARDSIGTATDTVVIDINDLAVGAPGDFVTINGQSYAAGSVHLLSGSVSGPSVNRNVAPSLNNFTDSTVTISLSYAQGTFPINGAFVTINGETQELDPSQNPYRFTLTSETTQQFNIRYLVTDELDLSASLDFRIRFANKPVEFGLISDRSDELIELIGDKDTNFNLASESSSDPDVTNLTYRLILGLSDDKSLLGSNLFSRVTSESDPDITLTYEILNNFLINRNVALGSERRVYWTIEASNGVFSTVASDSLRSFRAVRRGLTSEFDLITEPGFYLIDMNEEGDLGFNWTNLSSENPNASVRYRFRLLAEQDVESTAIFDTLSADNGFESQVQIDYRQLYRTVEQQGELNEALSDTVTYYYTVQSVVDGSEEYFPNDQPREVRLHFIQRVGYAEELLQRPRTFEVYPNYPNPFNPSTTLRYALPDARSVTIAIYSILGQEVYRWQSGRAQSPGTYTRAIDASSWASGIYIYRVQAGKSMKSGKMTLIK